MQGRTGTDASKSLSIAKHTTYNVGKDCTGWQNSSVLFLVIVAVVGIDIVDGALLLLCCWYRWRNHRCCTATLLLSRLRFFVLGQSALVELVHLFLGALGQSFAVSIMGRQSRIFIELRILTDELLFGLKHHSWMLCILGLFGLQFGQFLLFGFGFGYRQGVKHGAWEVVTKLLIEFTSMFLVGLIGVSNTAGTSRCCLAT
mmetsp:Transcript_31620/g.44902  ORF Transcript_31620/g.44902 Transcript_31620/m.44902 type:complete len:201 (+) Transcript_31620:138-740(+)